MKLVKFCIFSLLISMNAFSQSYSNFEITQDKKGKFSLVDKRNRNIVNEYKGCDLIDSIHSLKYPTNPEYVDYVIIQKRKKLFIYNTSIEKEIINVELKSKFSIRIYEVRPEINELEYNRLNQNTVSNYINILIEGEGATVSLLLNFNSRNIISAKQSYCATFYYLIKENLILGQSLDESFVVDEKGKKLVPSKLYKWFHHFNGGFAFKNDNYKYGVVNYSGDTIVPFIYENAEAHPKNDFVILENSDKKAGVINKHGKIVVPFVYKPKHPNYYRSYSYTNYGVFMLYKTSYSDSNFVFVDTNGVELIKEANYQNAWELRTPYENSYNKRYYFVENRKAGVYDTKQKKEIIQCKYSFFKELDDTRFGVISAKDEKGNWGLLSLESGSTIIPFEYESIKSKLFFTNDSVVTFIISKQGKFGIINYKGNTQLSCEYSNITKTAYENFVVVEKDGTYGIFDIRTSHFVVPIELKSIDKNLKIEKMENGILLKGKYDVKENHIKWEE